MKTFNKPITIKGLTRSLNIQADDTLAIKMSMIIESIFSNLKPKEIAEKYNYTREHYYYILRKFKEEGTKGLINKNSGPKRNYVRTETIENQIIRHRFLDPDASLEVIAQKMRQSGFKVSKRSVERTITEYGLQKKTLHLKSSEKQRKNS